MTARVGIILLDGEEIVLRIYGYDKRNTLKLIHYQCYDLASGVPEKYATSTEFIEIIAGVLLTRYAALVTDWKLCARNLHETIADDISAATGMHPETLTLQREQELLCKGILMETE